jgi:parallel beta-helix repeat protein
MEQKESLKMAKAQRSSGGIKVFVSYSHKDEDLRVELEKHLSLLKQQGLISTWHDRKIIAGEDWGGKIDENLNSAQIILLLVSSDFLASEYCNEVEIARAMERHESGEARVIPIILRYVYWKGAIFADLQALPTNAEPIKDGNWRSVDAAFTDVAKGLEQVIKSFNPLLNSPNPETITVDPSPPTEKKSPKTIVVDQMGQGDYITITEALQAAKVGCKILVRPGLYEEFLEIDKPVEIIGDGEKADIEIRAAGKHTLAFRAAQGRIANLTLRQIDAGEFNCVDISKGRLILEDCDLSGQGNHCIVIRDSADPRLRRNTIHDSKGNGVFVTDKGQGILEGNDIFGNVGSPQIRIDKGSNPTFRSNRIHNAKSNGVLITDNGLGILEDNDIFGHGKPQVAIDAGGNPTLRRNVIHDGKSNGIRVTGNSQGILEDNDIFGHDFPQVAIDAGGNPTLRGNRIHDGKGNGVQIEDNGLGILEENDISGNECPQVVIKTCGNPTLRGNRIHDGKSNGVLIIDNGLGILEENDIFNHESSQVFISKGGNPLLRGNRIHDGKLDGIYIGKDSQGTFENNDLRNNKDGAWDIHKGSLSQVKRVGNLE